MGGRGSSNPQGSGGGKSGKVPEWRSDYNRVLKEEQKYRDKARAMDAEVKAAKDAYYAAPTRSKAQKAEAERLEQRMNEVTMRQSMLQYRAAQMGTLADNILLKYAPGEYRRKKKVRNSR